MLENVLLVSFHPEITLRGMQFIGAVPVAEGEPSFYKATDSIIAPCNLQLKGGVTEQKIISLNCQ